MAIRRNSDKTFSRCIISHRIISSSTTTTSNINNHHRNKISSPLSASLLLIKNNNNSSNKLIDTTRNSSLLSHVNNNNNEFKSLNYNNNKRPTKTPSTCKTSNFSYRLLATFVVLAIAAHGVSLTTSLWVPPVRHDISSSNKNKNNNNNNNHYHHVIAGTKAGIRAEQHNLQKRNNNNNIDNNFVINAHHQSDNLHRQNNLPTSTNFDSSISAPKLRYLGRARLSPDELDQLNQKTGNNLLFMARRDDGDSDDGDSHEHVINNQIARARFNQDRSNSITNDYDNQNSAFAGYNYNSNSDDDDNTDNDNVDVDSSANEDKALNQIDINYNNNNNNRRLANSVLMSKALNELVESLGKTYNYAGSSLDENPSLDDQQQSTNILPAYLQALNARVQHTANNDNDNNDNDDDENDDATAQNSIVDIVEPKMKIPIRFNSPDSYSFTNNLNSNDIDTGTDTDSDSLNDNDQSSQNGDQSIDDNGDLTTNNNNNNNQKNQTLNVSIDKKKSNKTAVPAGAVLAYNANETPTLLHQASSGKLIEGHVVNNEQMTSSIGTNQEHQNKRNVLTGATINWWRQPVVYLSTLFSGNHSDIVEEQPQQQQQQQHHQKKIGNQEKSDKPIGNKNESVNEHHWYDPIKAYFVRWTGGSDTGKQQVKATKHQGSNNEGQKELEEEDNLGKQEREAEMALASNLANSHSIQNSATVNKVEIDSKPTIANLKLAKPESTSEPTLVTLPLAGQHHRAFNHRYPIDGDDGESLNIKHFRTTNDDVATQSEISDDGMKNNHLSLLRNPLTINGDVREQFTDTQDGANEFTDSSSNDRSSLGQNTNRQHDNYKDYVPFMSLFSGDGDDERSSLRSYSPSLSSRSAPSKSDDDDDDDYNNNNLRPSGFLSSLAALRAATFGSPSEPHHNLLAPEVATVSNYVVDETFMEPQQSQPQSQPQPQLQKKQTFSHGGNQAAARSFSPSHHHLMSGLPMNDAHAHQYYGQSNDLYFVVLVAGFSLMVVGFVLSIGLFAYRVQQTRKSVSDVDYPTYGVVGPSLSTKPPGGGLGGANILTNNNSGNVANSNSQSPAGKSCSGSITGAGSTRSLADLVSPNGSVSHLNKLSSLVGGSIDQLHYHSNSNNNNQNINQQQRSNSANSSANGLQNVGHSEQQQHQQQQKSSGSGGTNTTIALNQNAARMYHYHHQKQQMITSDKTMNARHASGSDCDSDDENDDGAYTVYECPGLASTHEMEVKNPLFLDDPTPVNSPAIK